MSRHSEWILIIDYGSPSTQLIARKLRSLNIYCEIHPYNSNIENLNASSPGGIILSGSPKKTSDSNAPAAGFNFMESSVPLLATGYGIRHLLYTENRDSVAVLKEKPLEKERLNILHRDPLLQNLPGSTDISAQDEEVIIKPGPHWAVLAEISGRPAIIKHTEKQIYGVQFHPEEDANESGIQLLNNFARNICGLTADWTAEVFIDEQIKAVKEKAGSDLVLCALSGGVDSTVVAVLLHKALGNQLQCIFVDTGLLRKNEYNDVLALYERELKLPVKGVDASALFLERLKGVDGPEKKRKIIGTTFIDVFEQEIGADSNFKYLAQGTLYPDVIESISFDGEKVAVKSHHNVGGLPEKMKLELLEPVRDLFKYEVRNVGRALQIPEHFITRHPFPGPGLGVRMLGSITKEKLNILREADSIFIEELRAQNLYDKVWQALAVLLPVKSVGVSGGQRTYEAAVALRAVLSTDGMSAKVAELPYSFLDHVSKRIINEVSGVNRVVYDISPKPPATIEWE